jgi:hypothetical protein
MFSYAILVYYLGKLYDNFLCHNLCISDYLDWTMDSYDY